MQQFRMWVGGTQTRVSIDWSFFSNQAVLKVQGFMMYMSSKVGSSHVAYMSISRFDECPIPYFM